MGVKSTKPVHKTRGIAGLAPPLGFPWGVLRASPPVPESPSKIQDTYNKKHLMVPDPGAEPITIILQRKRHSYWYRNLQCELVQGMGVG